MGRGTANQSDSGTQTTMSVYVDNGRKRYRGLLMCHMVADTDEELHAMADVLGIDRKHHQCAGTEKSHYDICQEKRAIAVKHGATEVSQKDVVRIVQARRATVKGGQR